MPRSPLLRVRLLFASASNSKGASGVSVCGDLLNVFLKKSFFSQSLILGYVNEFVCQQPEIFSESRRTMTPCPAVRPSYPLSEVKAGVSWILLRGATDTIDINSLCLE